MSRDSSYRRLGSLQARGSGADSVRGSSDEDMAEAVSNQIAVTISEDLIYQKRDRNHGTHDPQLVLFAETAE